MKRYTLYFPLLALGVLTALWLRHAKDEHAALQAAIATQRAGIAAPPDDRAALMARNNTKGPEEDNAALQAELRRIECHRTIDAQARTLVVAPEVAGLERRHHIPKPDMSTLLDESFE